jgi:hypothetical protein
MTNRLYPLARPTSGTDARFTFGLIYDVGQVLESHGFPPVRGGDHVNLMSALFRFLYAEEEQPAPAPAAYGDAERDGTRCISCHTDFAPTDVGEWERIPAGVIDGGRMGFAHHVCIFPSRASEFAALDAELGTAPAVSAPEGSRREDNEIKGTGADLPTVHYAHAMTGKGAQTPRCGAAGQTVLFAYNVTCPRCLALLAEQEFITEQAEAVIEEWVPKSATPTLLAEAEEQERRVPLSAGDVRRWVVGATAADVPFARGNSEGRCYWCDGTTVICFTCKAPGPDNHVGAAHEPNMLPCRECNGGSYPVRPPEPFRPCGDCYSPLTCEEADELRCP